jgi:hypothetical protein
MFWEFVWIWVWVVSLWVVISVQGRISRDHNHHRNEVPKITIIDHHTV